jgi:hypothetical protein
MSIFCENYRFKSDEMRLWLWGESQNKSKSENKGKGKGKGQGKNDRPNGKMYNRI